MTTPNPDHDPFPPQGVDLDHPSVARVYDYLLEGHHNWSIDRDFGEQLLTVFPLARQIAKANRQFLFRAVRQLMRHGVRQFIDLGAGIPTMDHTHTVADDFDPGTATVVYVDNEPVAVAHSQLILDQDGDPVRHRALNGDIRNADRLWTQILDTGLINPDRPIALMMIALLHVQQPDEHGHDLGDQLAARYRDLLPPGSYLALSHVTNQGVSTDIAHILNRVQRLYADSHSPVIWRSHDQIASLFGDFELLDPGLTWTPLWHPEETGSHLQDITFTDPSDAVIYAGIGRKPH